MKTTTAAASMQEWVGRLPGIDSELMNRAIGVDGARRRISELRARAADVDATACNDMQRDWASTIRQDAAANEHCARWEEASVVSAIQRRWTADEIAAAKAE
jgi:hypothetical protein